MRLRVEPEARASENLYSCVFTTYTASPLDSFQITNHYAGNDNVWGFKQVGGYDPLAVVLDKDAHGIDVQVQDAYVSEDWEYLAITQ